MKSLADALPKRPATNEERGIPPGDTCASCGSYPPGHECCYCRDGGRVSRGDGFLEMCPSCSGVRRSGDDVSELTPEEWARQARVPRKFSSVTIDNWTIERYRERSGSGDPRPSLRSWPIAWPPTKPFLSFLGAPGTGKTHLAVAAAREASKRHDVKVRMYRTDDLLLRYRASFNSDSAIETEQQIDTELQRVPLLILDDLTTTASSDWATRKILALVNQRYQDQVPTVITGNEEDLDERTHRRLLDESSGLAVKLTASTA